VDYKTEHVVLHEPWIELSVVGDDDVEQRSLLLHVVVVRKLVIVGL
jgi:hypothetical protein